MQQYLALLRRRPGFNRLWLAALISFAGDWFNTIASLMLVNRYLQSSSAIGLLFLARALPPFFLGPPAGVIADRLNRKAVLIGTDLARALIVLGFLFVDRPERAWLIYALTVAQFAISSLFEPARAAILPSLVEGGDELLAANTLSNITWSAMLALGAALGGLVAGIFGVPVALIIDAASFLLSAWLIWRIQTAAAPRPSDQGSGWQDMVDGFRYVGEHLRTGLTAAVKGATQIGSPDIMIAVYAAQLFPLGEGGAVSLGLLYAAAGVGAITGPLVANRLNDGGIKGLQNGIAVAFGVVAAGWLLFGWAPSLPVALAAMLLRHMGGSVNWTYSSVILQLRVPDRFLGRVFALDFAIFTLVTSLSVWLSGLLLDHTSFGPRQLAYAAAAGSLLPVIPWLWLNRNDPARERITAD